MSFLVAAGCLSAGVALFHLVAAFSPELSRSFGAPERLLAAGRAALAVAALAIAGVFVLWAAYAFSGAGLVRPLPFLLPGLTTITGVYLLRGLVLVPQVLTTCGVAVRKVPTTRRALLSSAVSLSIGIVHLAGTATVWSR